jgi:hypothetical protein
MSKLQRKLQDSSCESSLTSPKYHHVGDNGSNNNSSFRTQSKASKQPKNHHIKASSQDPKKHHVTDNSTKALTKREIQTDRQTDRLRGVCNNHGFKDLGGAMLGFLENSFLSRILENSCEEIQSNAFMNHTIATATKTQFADVPEWGLAP